MWEAFKKMRSHFHTYDWYDSSKEANKRVYKELDKYFGIGGYDVPLEFQKYIKEPITTSDVEYDQELEADEVAIVRFVFDNMDRKDISTAPSPGALAYLKACQSDSSLKAEFYRNVWPRLLPSKADLNNLGKKDDFSVVDDNIEKGLREFAETLLSDGPEGPSTEPEVQEIHLGQGEER